MFNIIFFSFFVVYRVSDVFLSVLQASLYPVQSIKMYTI